MTADNALGLAIYGQGMYRETATPTLSGRELQGTLGYHADRGCPLSSWVTL